MRHPYAEDNWNSHCRSQGHSNAVANLEAEKEVAGLNGLTQKPMTNFFRVVRKKKVGGEAVSKGATEPKSNTVDFLMDNKPTECAGCGIRFRDHGRRG